MTDLIVMKDLPMLIVREGNERYLVISDVHLGVSAYLGYNDFSDEINSILNLIRTTNNYGEYDGLILLGDVKHSIGQPTIHEINLIMKLFHTLEMEFKKIFLIKGNHDSKIESYVTPRVSLIGKNGLALGNTLFIHGHSLPGNFNYENTVLGHIHPHLNEGERYVHCWQIYQDDLMFRPNTVIVVPHCNSFLNRLKYSPGEPERIVPLFRKIKLKTYQLHTLHVT